MKKLFSLVLAFALVCAVLVPVTVVSAESETLLITDATDNGGTQEYSQARAAIPNLRKDGDLWYSAKRPDCDPSGSAVAIYRLGLAATVEGVRIGFYAAKDRTQTFSIDYSVDGENWASALGSTKSTKLDNYVEGTADQDYLDGVHPAETFTFASPVYAKFLRITLTATKTGFWDLFSNDYSAFHTFEAFGEYDPTAEPDSANYGEVYGIIDGLNHGEYPNARWHDVMDAIEAVDYDLNCFQQSTLNESVAAIRGVIDDAETFVAESEITYWHLRGAIAGEDASYDPAAALQDNEYYCRVTGTDEYEYPEVIYFLPQETALDHIIIDWYAPDMRTYTFSIAVSADDGQTWSTVYDWDEELVLSISSAFEYHLDGVHATHIKLIGNENTEDPDVLAAFRRFRAFGDLVENGVETTISCAADIPAFEHDYDAVVTEVTCTTDGYTTFTCSFCGDTYVGDHLDALGHDYVPTVTKPTCTAQGYTTYTCSHCGDTYVSDYVDALGHDYQDYTIEPTCTDQGYTVHLCMRCFDFYYTDYVDALGHTGGTATCTSKAVCERCHIEYGELDPENHEDCTELPWESDEEHHWKVCACGLIVLLSEHEYENETDLECLVCGHVRELIAYGDLNDDGIIELSDLTMLAKYVAGWVMDDDFHLSNADCNEDGNVDLTDVVLLAKYIAGWNVTLGPQA